MIEQNKQNNYVLSKGVDETKNQRWNFGRDDKTKKIKWRILKEGL